MKMLKEWKNFTELIMNRKELNNKLEKETYVYFFCFFTIVITMLSYAPVQSVNYCVYCDQVLDDEEEIEAIEYSDTWKCTYCGALNGSGANRRPRQCLSCLSYQ